MMIKIPQEQASRKEKAWMRWEERQHHVQMGRAEGVLEGDTTRRYSADARGLAMLSCHLVAKKLRAEVCCHTLSCVPPFQAQSIVPDLQLPWLKTLRALEKS